MRAAGPGAGGGGGGDCAALATGQQGGPRRPGPRRKGDRMSHLDGGAGPAQVRLAYAVLILTTIFWGGNAVAGRFAVGHVSPMVLTALRWSVAVAILAVIAGPRLMRDRKKVKAHLPLLFAYGAIGFAGFNIALYSALNHTTAINVAIWQAAIPIFIFMLNFAAFRVQASW